jgi:Bacterial Ig-like domain
MSHAQQSIDSMPPVVVKTSPEAGATNVSPGTVEIKVTFSKEMADGSWSWVEPWKGAHGTPLGKPKYDSDQKTCVFKVKLEPNKTYAFWLNRGQFQNFKDQQGHPSVPYLLAFQTKGN